MKNISAGLLAIAEAMGLAHNAKSLGPDVTESFMPRWRRNRGGYGRQKWRSFKTPDGWKLEFKQSPIPAGCFPGRRWARKNRAWLGGQNPKKPSFFAYQANPELATAA